MRRTLVIAEAGVNHDGSLDTALELVDVAVDAGADVVKFQTFQIAEVVTPNAPQAGYQQRNAPAGSQEEMLGSLVLDWEAHQAIAQHCRDRQIEFLSTAFDPGSLEWCLDLGVQRLKIPSGELTNGPLLLAIARAGLPMIMSTGMSTLADIETALSIVAYGLSGAEGPPSRAELGVAYERAIRDGLLAERVTLLHCTSNYPAAPEDVHLAAMDTLGSAFGLPVGYSDHTLGTVLGLAAVARGASVLEKHITLDSARPGPDHAASLEPDGLQELVAGIRAIEAAIGSPAKYPTAAERDTIAVARRSLVARREIAQGEAFEPSNLTVLRPASGRSPLDYWELLGRPASRAYAANELIDVSE